MCCISKEERHFAPDEVCATSRSRADRKCRRLQAPNPVALLIQLNIDFALERLLILTVRVSCFLPPPSGEMAPLCKVQESRPQDVTGFRPAQSAPPFLFFESVQSRSLARQKHLLLLLSLSFSRHVGLGGFLDVLLEG